MWRSAEPTAPCARDPRFPATWKGWLELQARAEAEADAAREAASQVHLRAGRVLPVPETPSDGEEAESNRKPTGLAKMDGTLETVPSTAPGRRGRLRSQSASRDERLSLCGSANCARRCGKSERSPDDREARQAQSDRRHRELRGRMDRVHR